MSTYYRTCRCCGGTLDPGERCDCQNQAHVRRAVAKAIKAELEAAHGSGAAVRMDRHTDKKKSPR